MDALLGSVEDYIEMREKAEAASAHHASWDIEWKPVHLLASFHGRDLFAPGAAMLACGEPPPGRPHNEGAHRQLDWADDLREIVYLDHFGNAMTGLRARTLARDAKIARRGSHVGAGADFWRPPARHGLLVRKFQWAC